MIKSDGYFEQGLGDTVGTSVGSMNLQLDLYENGAEPGQPACFDTRRARTDGCAHIGCAIAGSGADSDAGSDAGYTVRRWTRE